MRIYYLYQLNSINSATLKPYKHLKSSNIYRRHSDITYSAIILYLRWYLSIKTDPLLVEDLSKKLGRPISDLDDVRDSMAALAKIRSKEIEIDMVIGPIEVNHCYFV